MRAITFRKAFTLIELLVVISIIALLIAILLPYLSRTRETTRRTLCLSNLRQFHQGVSNYGLEHDGYYPDGQRDDGRYHTGYLSHKVYSYVLESAGGDPKIFTCPSRGHAQGGTPGATYVGLNGNNTPPNGRGWRLDGYVQLGGFDHTGWVDDPMWPLWDSVLMFDDSSPGTKIMADYSYQPGPGIPNPSLGMHGPRGWIIKGSVSLTPEELGIEGGNYVTVGGSAQWQNAREMQRYTVNSTGGAWNWY